MKQYLLLAVAFCVLFGVAGATSLNFQDSTDFSSVKFVQVGGVPTSYSESWIQSATGGNNYVMISSTGGATRSHRVMVLNNAFQSTYAAATLVGSSSSTGTGEIALLDASYNVLYTTGTASGRMDIISPGRYEVLIVGGTGYLYYNGVLLTTTPVLAQNPSYIGFGGGAGSAAGCCGWWTGYWDDYVYGELENRNITGNPEMDVYIIRNDLINPSASGLAYAANGTIINSNNFTSTYARSNITYLGNQSVQLVNSDTRIVYGTRYTGYSTLGSLSWAIQDELIDASAPNGFYHVTIEDSNVNSEQIQYTATGATLALDRANYSVGDTATASGEVQLGGYWDTSTYSYKVAFRDAYGNYVHNSSALTSRVFSEAYTFGDSDAQGAYYAILIATPLTGGADYWLALDYCQLTAYLNFDGYVNDETGAVISGAVVNITQDALVVNYTTGASGSYVASSFITGSQIIFNITSTAHQQYYKTTTPQSATSTTLNFTLPRDNKTYYGLAIGGVAREGILSGNDISDGFGKPIEGATVVLKNTTNGNYHTNLTNIAGWYLADEGSSIVLISKRPYDVWGMKTGYSNSANYTVVAP